MYIWHKEAKSTKFQLIDGPEATSSPHSFIGYVPRRRGLTDLQVTSFPKSEYEICPDPEPTRRWVDVTHELRLDHNGQIANLPHYHGLLVVNPYGHPVDAPTLRLVNRESMTMGRTVLTLEEYR